MVNILPKTEEKEGLGRSLGRELGEGLSRGSDKGIAMRVEQKENAALQRLLGKDLSGLPGDLKKEVAKQLMGTKYSKEKERQETLSLGFDTLQEMRQLVSSTGPMKSWASVIPGQTAKARAQFEKLGQSLIPLVSKGISIRNQREFEEYKKVIANPNAHQSDILGALDALESIISRQMAGVEKKETKQEKSQMVTMISPAGKKVSVPEDKVKEAMKAGGKVVK